MTEPGDEIPAVAGEPGRGRLRASHADRKQVTETLKAAFVQGRLTKDEFDARVGQAFTACTYAELAKVTADLPAGLTGAEPSRTPARAKARASADTPVMKGVRVIAVAAMLAASSWALAIFANVFESSVPPPLALILLLTMFGSTATVVVASILTVALTVESRHHRRSGGQLPPPAARSAGGPASPRRQAPADPTGPFPPGDYGHQHTAEAARSDHGDSDPSSSRPPRRWDPRGRRYAIGYASK